MGVGRPPLRLEFHRYRRLHYGDDIESATRTYISLIKFHSFRLAEGGRVPHDVKDTKVVLIGVNEEEESRIWNAASRDADSVVGPANRTKNMLPEKGRFSLFTLLSFIGCFFSGGRPGDSADPVATKCHAAQCVGCTF